MKFRNLKANEIDVRVQSASEKGAILLLYKDARCDMNVLDESVGPLNWKREHSRENSNCTVSIWDNGKEQWVGKEDTGTESFTEKEKGLASDSFKRACFNWGIGRELYTAPFIWVNGCTYDTGRKDKNNRPVYACNSKFIVSKIETVDGEIVKLEIVETKGNKTVFNFGDKTKVEPPKQPKPAFNIANAIKSIEKISEGKEDKLMEYMEQLKINNLATATEKQCRDLYARLKNE